MVTASCHPVLQSTKKQDEPTNPAACSDTQFNIGTLIKNENNNAAFQEIRGDT